MNENIKALIQELLSQSPNNPTKRMLLDSIAENRMAFVEFISNTDDPEDETHTVVFKYKDKFYSFFSTYNSYSESSDYLVNSLKEVFPVEKVTVSYE